MRSRQRACAAGWRARRRREQLSDDAGTNARAVHDARDDHPDGVRLRPGGSRVPQSGRVGPGRRGLAFNNVYGLGVEDGRRSEEARTGFDPIAIPSRRLQTAPRMPETMRGPMLRALIERRFQLKAHIETEQIPAFIADDRQERPEDQASRIRCGGQVRVRDRHEGRRRVRRAAAARAGPACNRPTGPARRASAAVPCARAAHDHPDA